MPDIRPKQAKISTGSTDNDTLTTRGYVNEHVGNGMWERSGTDLTPKNAGDDVDIGIGGLKDNDVTTAIPLGSAGATSLDTSAQNIVGAINEVNSLHTSATQESLTISTPGQTAFTLSETPSGDAAFGLYLNGQLRTLTTDYTRTGTSLTWQDPGGLTLLTTDELRAWYDYSAPAFLSPWKRSGDVISPDNDGDDIEYKSSSDATYPLFYQQNADHNDISTAYDAYYDSGWKSASTNYNVRWHKTTDNLNLQIDDSIALGDPVSWVSNLNINFPTNTYEFSANVKSETLVLTGDSQTQQVDGIVNTITVPYSSSHLVTEEGIQSYINTRAGFSASSNTQSNVTGDNTWHTIIYGSEHYDNTSNYNTSTGHFVTPTKGLWIFTYDIVFTDVGSGFDEAQTQLSIGGVKTGYTHIPFNNTTSNNHVALNGSMIMEVNQGVTVYVQGRVGGPSKTVDIGSGSTFSGYLLQET